jgi:hypothetical protein
VSPVRASIETGGGGGTNANEILPHLYGVGAHLPRTIAEPARHGGIEDKQGPVTQMRPTKRCRTTYSWIRSGEIVRRSWDVAHQQATQGA